MGKRHRSIIRTYLWLERVALESIEGHESVEGRYMTQMPSEDGEDDPISEVQTPLTGGSTQYRRLSLPLVAATAIMHCPAQPWKRHLCLGIAMLILFALEMVYYVIHAVTGGNNEAVPFSIYLLLFSMTLAALLCFMSFPFAAPLHRSLGFLDPNITPAVYRSRLDQLYVDAGTCRIIDLTLVMAVVYCFGDCSYFRSEISGTALYFCYVFATALDVVTFYGAILGITLTMRAFLSRLRHIEEEVVMSLEGGSTAENLRHSFELHQSYAAIVWNDGEDGTEVQNNSGPRRVVPTTHQVRTLTQEWAAELACIRRDVNDLAETFGPRMLLGLFLFLVITTSLVTVVFEITEHDETQIHKFFMSLLFPFVGNSVVLIAAFYSIAYLVVQCQHHVGPKLSLLAARGLPETRELALTFLLAPVKFHVGTFEVSPEYSNFVSIWLIGLFFYTLGIKIPGEA